MGRHWPLNRFRSVDARNPAITVLYLDIANASQTLRCDASVGPIVRPAFPAQHARLGRHVYLPRRYLYAEIPK